MCRAMSETGIQHSLQQMGTGIEPGTSELLLWDLGKVSHLCAGPVGPAC